MRYVLVTGAAKGIGRACVAHLHAQGMHVFAGVRRPDDGTAIASALGTTRITPLLLDITDQQHIATAATTIAATVGDAGLWGLVNNAGIAVPGPLEVLPLADFQQQLAVNVTGQLAVTQQLLPLIRQARGRIVLLSSISGRLSLPGFGAYAASKFALEAMGDALRLELRPWGIQVALIQPGAIATPIWDNTRARTDATLHALDPARRALYAALIAANRQRATESASRAIPPQRVARAVGHALTARRARPRYAVGTDARAALLLAALPDWVRDTLIARALDIRPAPVPTSTTAGTAGTADRQTDNRQHGG